MMVGLLYRATARGGWLATSHHIRALSTSSVISAARVVREEVAHGTDPSMDARVGYQTSSCDRPQGEDCP
jgi:hypothetical protein